MPLLVSPKPAKATHRPSYSSPILVTRKNRRSPSPRGIMSPFRRSVSPKRDSSSRGSPKRALSPKKSDIYRKSKTDNSEAKHSNNRKGRIRDSLDAFLTMDLVDQSSECATRSVSSDPCLYHEHPLSRRGSNSSYHEHPLSRRGSNSSYSSASRKERRHSRNQSWGSRSRSVQKTDKEMKRSKPRSRSMGTTSQNHPNEFQRYAPSRHSSLETNSSRLSNALASVSSAPSRTAKYVGGYFIADRVLGKKNLDQHDDDLSTLSGFSYPYASAEMKTDDIDISDKGASLISRGLRALERAYDSMNEQPPRDDTSE